MSASLDTSLKYGVFTDEELSLVTLRDTPEHVALVMDGNRRWAKSRGQVGEVGHWKGAETLDLIVRAADQLRIKVLTVYAFSTENWSRPQQEIELLMQIFESYLISKRKSLIQEGVKLEIIGERTKLPQSVQKELKETEKATKQCKRITLVVAVNYGGRDEIIRAVRKMVKDVGRKKLKRKEITEAVMNEYLDTKKWRDPDLVIRTGGEMRISNFLPWQCCYSEIVVTDVLWPDFSPHDLLQAVVTYQSRNRRFGG